jgi:hypothetical protein
MASHAGWTSEREKEQGGGVRKQSEEEVRESERPKVSKAATPFFHGEEGPHQLIPTLAWCARGCKAHSTKAVTSMALHAWTARFTTFGVSSASRYESVSAARGSNPLSLTLRESEKGIRK